MDVCKLKKALGRKHSAIGNARLPLVPADNKNGAARQPRVSSRYGSPTLSAATGSKRSPSPNPSRLSSASIASAPKRAASTERRRPPRASSPQSPSTPVEDTAAEMVVSSRKVADNKLPDSLWPSTMRSLSVSFQSDAFFVPTSKREKAVSHTHSDRKQSPNSAHRQPIISASRKPIPERKRSPCKGKSFVDQSENCKTVNSLNHRLVDQHRWPSRKSGKLSTPLNRNVDLADKASKSSSVSSSGTSSPSSLKLPLDGTITPLEKSTSNLLLLISRHESGKAMLNECVDDGGPLRVQRLGSSISSDRIQLGNAAARAMSLPHPGSHPASPSASRGLSPSRAKAVNPSSRGYSPARLRPSSPSRQPQSSTSVLSFIADIKREKKAANHIEDVHQLRLSYNRQLQWRFANAQTDATVQARKEKAEKMLYSVWREIAGLSDLIMERKIDLQKLKLKLNLNSILNNQLAYLGEWASIEKDYLSSLACAIQDLQSSTIRIPVTGGAMGDIGAVKAAVRSAIDVMQALGSSLCSILPKVEGMNCLVSELAGVAANERAMLDVCESMLASTAALQVEEYSHRTHVLQGCRDEELY